jgi:hypothetical protein
MPRQAVGTRHLSLRRVAPARLLVNGKSASSSPSPSIRHAQFSFLGYIDTNVERIHVRSGVSFPHGHPTIDLLVNCSL